MLGKTIKVKKEHRKAIRALVGDVSNARSAYSLATRMHTDAEKALWDTLHELYPEVVDYNAAINHKSLEIYLKARLN